MTKIKICGLTSKQDALYLHYPQVNFAGIVLFFPKSKRNVTIETAKEILNSLDSKIHPVAVTVSPTKEQVKQIESAGFHYLQVHGELEEEIINLCHIPIFRAFNISDMTHFPQMKKYDQVYGYIFDAPNPGSGKIFDWSILRAVPRNEKLFILAGGLNAENVSDAIKLLHPDVVDVSSGVENDSGIGKDQDKIQKFIERVHRSSN